MFSGILLLVGLISLLTPLKTLSQETIANVGNQLELKPVIHLDKYFESDEGILYGISRTNGLMFSGNHGDTWEERTNGLPLKNVYPNQETKVRLLTGLGVDPINPARVALTTSTTIYLSNDYGMNWTAIKVNHPVPDGAYLTSIALSPFDPNTLLVGTSFNGIYETNNLGKSWSNISSPLKFLYRGAGFWEEIAALSYDPQAEAQIIFSGGFGKGVYRMSMKTNKYEKLPLPELQDKIVTGLNYHKNPESFINNQQPWLLKISTEDNELTFASTFEFLSKKERLFSRSIDPQKLERQKKASGKNGLYLRYDYASGKRLDQMIRFLKEKNLNAVVIDFKDDNGLITYNTNLELPQKMKAVRPRVNIETFLKKAKENGIYVIGRLVVFKDQQLYKYSNYKYAIWDRFSDQPWRYLVKQTDSSTNKTAMVQREFWVDPYHSDVWDYNISLAEELQSLGVDEIQFDYIRFPTDGDLSRTKYRYRKEDMEKKDALESFLAKAREKIQIPISTDLYGYNCWYRMDSWNGQNMEIFSDYVDVICPMYYPSHFPSGFIKELPYLDRAKLIYSEGTRRAYAIAGGNSIVRPYIQAFLLGGERRMTIDTYSKYLFNQIEGTREVSSAGFILWNFSNNYYMLTKSLSNEP